MSDTDSDVYHHRCQSSPESGFLSSWSLSRQRLDSGHILRPNPWLYMEPSTTWFRPVYSSCQSCYLKRVLSSCHWHGQWTVRLIEFKLLSYYYISAHRCYLFSDVHFSSDVADVWIGLTLKSIRGIKTHFWHHLHFIMFYLLTDLITTTEFTSSWAITQWPRCTVDECKCKTISCTKDLR